MRMSITMICLRTIRTVAELLEDIVQRQIVADVPRCVCSPVGSTLGRNGDGSPGARRPATRTDTLVLRSTSPVMAQPLSRATSTSL